MKQWLIHEEEHMKIDVRRGGMAVLKTLLFVLALLYLADYFGWALFTEAGGRTVTPS